MFFCFTIFISVMDMLSRSSRFWTMRYTAYLPAVPKGPNPIGLSIVKLVRVDGPVLHVEDVDVVDGTPLLDVKPYVPLFDSATDVRTGWFTDRADGVFAAVLTVASGNEGSL